VASLEEAQVERPTCAASAQESQAEGLVKKTVKRGKKPPLARRSNGRAAAATRRMEQVGLGMSLGEQVVVAPKPRVDPSAWDVAAMVQARIHRANAVGELNEAQNDLIEATRVAFEAQHAAIEAPHRNANVERASRRVHEAAKSASGITAAISAPTNPSVASAISPRLHPRFSGSAARFRHSTSLTRSLILAAIAPSPFRSTAGRRDSNPAGSLC
jgi:hypothetical protein